MKVLQTPEEYTEERRTARKQAYLKRYGQISHYAKVGVE